MIFQLQTWKHKQGHLDLDSGSETGGIDVTTAGLPMMLPEIPLHASVSGALHASVSGALHASISGAL